MCVIVIDPEGKDLDFSILKLGIERNPDGWGLTYISDGKLWTSKGFGFKGAKKAWIRAKGHSRVFHARVGTHGTKTIENCHPFNCSTAVEARVFFHNGTVGIPRFNPGMCDSWHVAQLLKQFPTDEITLKNLGEYAEKEHSRFVLMTPEKVRWWGKGWLTRDGVHYSNASCLSETRTFNNCGVHRVVYEGGLLANKEIEITCPDMVSGWGYDTDRKLYSSTKTVEVAKKHWESQFPYNEEHNHPGCRWDYTRRLWVNKITDEPEVASKEKNALVGLPKIGGTTGANGSASIEDKSSRLNIPIIGGQRKSDSPLLNKTLPMTDENVKKIKEELNDDWIAAMMDAVIKAPWMSTVGGDGVQKSWPKDFDFLNVRNRFGHNQTYRVFTPNSSTWREMVYTHDGRFDKTFDVSGAYPDGLIITMKQDLVQWGSNMLSMAIWKKMILQRVRKFIESETVETEDEEVDNLMEEENLPFGIRQELADALALDDSSQSVGEKLAEQIKALNSNGIKSSRLTTNQKGQSIIQIVKLDGTVLEINHIGTKT